MLELLPKKQKKKIMREYHLRFFVVIFSLALVGEIISLILLIPPYVTAESRIDSLKAQSADFKAQNIVTETASLLDIVKQVNVNLNALNASSTPTGVVDAIKVVSEGKGTLVKINGINYKIQNGQRQFTISGIAGTRESLVTFVKNLKNQPSVVSANLPVSNLAKARDIGFSITVMMKP